MYQYLKDNTGAVRTDVIWRVADGATIPCVDGNRDYEEYKVWLAVKGNKPLAAA